MELPPDSGAGPERLVAPRPTPPVTPAEVARRLEAVESGLADLRARVEALGTEIPAAVHVAAAAEVQAASGELRHTVSELGRLLVRDLGKLSQILAQHRDAILDELRGPGSPADPAPPTPPPVDRAPGPTEAAGGEPDGLPGPGTAESGGGPPAGGDTDAAQGDEHAGGDRPWRRRRRPS